MPRQPLLLQVRCRKCGDRRRRRGYDSGGDVWAQNKVIFGDLYAKKLVAWSTELRHEEGPHLVMGAGPRAATRKR